MHPRSLAADPHEAEFFHGEEGSDIEHTDPLIREALQNSLDARNPNSALQRVEVRIAVHRGADAVAIDQASPWVEGLLPHLVELGAPVCAGGDWPARVGFLVVEDFGTYGLQGDVHRCSDPEPGQREDFYWFWRNVGRSGKTDDQRGRWGLGKTVFQASSQANSILGLTVRANDALSLLMGQCVTKVHQLQDSRAGTTKRYVPHGFFARPAGSEGVTAEDPQLPASDPSLLGAFRETFCLGRGDDPGLSIVSLFPIDEIQPDGLIQSAISHFFLPIMRGDLVVRVCSGKSSEVVIDAMSIEGLSAGVRWDSKRGRQNTAPPFSLVRRLLQRKPEFDLNMRQDGKAPELTFDSFQPEVLEALRQRYLDGEPISIRFLMDVIHKERGAKETWFDVYLEYDSNLQRGEDHYVRGGMKIGGIDGMRRSPPWRGLLVVEHTELSGLLGDVEGPAHNDWSQATGRRAADRNWKTWVKRVAFVKLAMPRLLNILDQSDQALDVEALSDLFYLPEQDDAGGRRRKVESGGDAPDPVPPPPPPDPDIPPVDPGFNVEKQADGFHLSCSDAFEPGRIRVRAVYDSDGASAWKSWSPLDFQFDAPERNGLSIAHEQCEILEAEDNRLVVDARPGTVLRVSGFNEDLDLLVRAEVERDNQEAEELE